MSSDCCNSTFCYKFWHNVQSWTTHSYGFNLFPWSFFRRCRLRFCGSSMSFFCSRAVVVAITINAKVVAINLAYCVCVCVLFLHHFPSQRAYRILVVTIFKKCLHTQIHFSSLFHDRRKWNKNNNNNNNNKNKYCEIHTTTAYLALNRIRLNFSVVYISCERVCVCVCCLLMFYVLVSLARSVYIEQHWYHLLVCAVSYVCIFIAFLLFKAER